MKNKENIQKDTKKKSDWRTIGLGWLILIWLVPAIALVFDPYSFHLHLALYGASAVMVVFLVIAYSGKTLSWTGRRWGSKT